MVVFEGVTSARCVKASVARERRRAFSSAVDVATATASVVGGGRAVAKDAFAGRPCFAVIRLIVALSCGLTLA